MDSAVTFQAPIDGQKVNVQVVQYWTLLDAELLSNPFFCHQGRFASYWSDSVNKNEPNNV